MITKCKYFSIIELLASEILAICSESLCWQMITRKAKTGLDYLREDLGTPIYINSKKYNFNYSGVRPVNCKIGAKYSNHKNGDTFDLKTFDNDELEVLHNLIIENWKEYSITRIENPEVTMPRGWLHVQFGDVSRQSELTVFNP